jgi:hypothetical protein
MGDMTTRALLVTGLLLVAPASRARELYVSPTGTDETSLTERFDDLGRLVDCRTGGTEAAPWKSLQKAAFCARAGDTILLRAGRHGRSCVDYQNNRFAFVAVNGGTQAQPIRLTSYPGEHAVVTDIIRLDDRLFTGGVNGAWYIVENLDLEGGGVIISAQGVVVRGNHIHHVNRDCGLNPAGIQLDGAKGVVSARDILIEDNVIHDNFSQDGGNDYRSVPGFPPNCPGIMMMHDTARITIRRNVIYNEPVGIRYKYENEGEGHVVQGNVIHDTVIGLKSGNNDLDISGNVFFDMDQGLELSQSESTSGSQNVRVRSNTFVTSQRGVAFYFGTGRLENNVFAGTNLTPQVLIGAMAFPRAPFTALVANDNCFAPAPKVYRYGRGFTADRDDLSLEEVRQVFGAEQQGVQAAAEFVDAGGEDFRQTAGSPCGARGASIASVSQKDGGGPASVDAGPVADGGTVADAGVVEASDAGPSVSDGAERARGSCGCQGIEGLAGMAALGAWLRRRARWKRVALTA